MERAASERPARASLAFLGGVICPGLGYLYAGRLRFAVATVLALFGIVAVAGWTRLILLPPSYYVTLALLLLVYLASCIHAAVIARRAGTLAAKPYNRVWIYLLWFAGLVVIGNVTPLFRADLFGFEPFRIPSSSMLPTLRPGDLIIVDTWRYASQDPAIDDLVVFDQPKNVGVKYVFRVVGLPGDRIELRDNQLYRNGAAVAEDFIQLTRLVAGRSSDFDPLVVAEDHFLVLGDNRHNARDSRYIGPIPRDLLHGRVEYRYFAYDQGITWSRFPALLNHAGG